MRVGSCAAAALFCLAIMGCESRAPSGDGAAGHTSPAPAAVASDTSPPPDSAALAAEPPVVANPDETEAAPPTVAAAAAREDAAVSPGAEADPQAALFDPMQPLPEAARAVLWGTPQDDPPEILDASRPDLVGRHYMSSDEWNLHLFEPVLRGRGGAYMGVGTDQGYLLVGWQRPAFAFLADYDPWVTVLHWIYAAFFEHAESPQALLAYFADAEAGAALLREHYAEHAQLEFMLKLYERYRRRVSGRLTRLRDRLTEVEVAGFVNDQAQYDFVRHLVRSRRVRPLQSNLLADRGVRGIAEALQQVGLPLRAFYVSNAESYWPWTTGEFIANVKALPFDEQSLVLRTLASHPVNDDYRYNAQPALSFLPWLEDRRIPPEVIYMIPRRRLTGPEDVEYLFFDEPPEFGVERLKARRERKRASE